MFVIVGAAGKVGHATAVALREAGATVRAVVRDAGKARRLADIGCQIALADIQDPGSLVRALADADGVQVIVPLSPAAVDPVADMHRSMKGIIGALERARPPRILAISDYGAHVAQDIGMPSLFQAFEQQLSRLDGHKLILRSAEHLQNQARSMIASTSSGVLATFQEHVDRKLPTISAPDLGPIASALLLKSAGSKDLEVIHAEGPHRYSANDIAAALTEVSGRNIQVRAIPRSHWEEGFRGKVPASLAALLIKANDAINKGGLVDVGPDATEICRGTTELIEAVRALLSTS